jgi:phenylpropionate dioxygenase-like ring-hydroxylating dioxygenase large terminal subunit
VFIRNCWYVIAWTHEIADDALFSRVVLGEPILVYRRADGNLTALEDRCCHRLAPLSVGTREDDCVRCGYHGLKFDANGRCVEIPGTDRVPSKARVRTYPIEVKNKWVFIWMGEPDRADVALLPDNFSCDSPDWKYQPGYMHYDTNYQLICDNLLDFSHLTFVHPTTLGGSPEIARSRADIESIPRGVRVTRRIPNIPAPGLYKRFRQFDMPIDRWFIYDFVLPGTLLMHSGGKPVGSADNDMTDAVLLHSCQTLTPETANSTHYFFQQAHRSSEGDDQIAHHIYEVLVKAFTEDRDMIGAQARNLALSEGIEMLPLSMDAALIQYRRIVESELAAQQHGSRDSTA